MLQLRQTRPLCDELQSAEEVPGTFALTIAPPLQIPFEIAITIQIPIPTALILETQERRKVKFRGNQEWFPAQRSKTNRS